jgi:branched-chain amino acid aminotransferase
VSENRESYIRVMLTRGTGALGLDPGLATHPLRVIIVTPLTLPPQSAYEDGIAVITFRTQRLGDATTAAGAKVGNYLVAVLAMKQAREHDAVEALVVDRDGMIVEGSTSNVFGVKGRRLITPSESIGILPGITRARVLRVAEQEGLTVEYRTLDPAELSTLDEMFISSSVRELMPVVRVDGQPVGDGQPGPVVRALLKRFRERLRADMGLEPGE